MLGEARIDQPKQCNKQLGRMQSNCVVRASGWDYGG